MPTSASITIQSTSLKLQTISPGEWAIQGPHKIPHNQTSDRALAFPCHPHLLHDITSPSSINSQSPRNPERQTSEPTVLILDIAIQGKSPREANPAFKT
jgi:hypothetical protein